MLILDLWKKLEKAGDKDKERVLFGQMNKDMNFCFKNMEKQFKTLLKDFKLNGDE